MSQYILHYKTKKKKEKHLYKTKFERNHKNRIMYKQSCTVYIYIYISLKKQLNDIKIFKSYDAPKFNVFNFLPQLNYSLKKNI